MSIELLALATAIMIHLVIFTRSSSISKKKRLIISLSMIGVSLVLFLLGLMIGLGGNYDLKNVAIVLMYAPVYIPLLTFFVYLPVFNKQT